MLYLDVEEIWTPLIYKGIPTHYSISNLGNIRNDKTSKILKQFIQNNGYYGFTISINNKPHSLKTAKQVAKHFIQNPDPDKYTQVNHIRGKKKCDNSVFNLEWVTPKQNKQHAIKHGLFTPLEGEKNPNAKYTNNQIKDACEYMSENKLSPEDIYNSTGVKIDVLFDIYNGSRWKCISKKYNVKNYTKLPKPSNKKYSEDDIRKVCILINRGYRNKEIIKVTGYSKDFIKRLRAGKTHKKIASKYLIK